VEAVKPTAKQITEENFIIMEGVLKKVKEKEKNERNDFFALYSNRRSLAIIRLALSFPLSVISIL
jgi:hypothetical protein